MAGTIFRDPAVPRRRRSRARRHPRRDPDLPDLPSEGRLVTTETDAIRFAERLLPDGVALCDEDHHFTPSNHRDLVHAFDPLT